MKLKSSVSQFLVQSWYSINTEKSKVINLNACSPHLKNEYPNKLNVKQSRVSRKTSFNYMPEIIMLCLKSMQWLCLPSQMLLDKCPDKYCWRNILEKCIFFSWNICRIHHKKLVLIPMAHHKVNLVR